MARLELWWPLVMEFGIIVIPYWQLLLVTIPNNLSLRALQMGDAPSAQCHVTKSEGVQDILYATSGMPFIYFPCQTIIQQLSMPRVVMLASNLPTTLSGSTSHLPIYFFRSLLTSYICYIWVEHSARLEQVGCNQDVSLIDDGASASSTLSEH